MNNKKSVAEKLLQINAIKLSANKPFTRASIAVLKKEQPEVEGMASIFNYGLDTAKDPFASVKVNYHSLMDYDALVTLAMEKSYISETDQNTLLNRGADAAKWKVTS